MKREGEGTLAAGIASKLGAVQRELNVYRVGTPLGFALYGQLTQADKVKIVKQVGEAAQELTAVAEKLAIGQ